MLIPHLIAEPWSSLFAGQVRFMMHFGCQRPRDLSRSLSGLGLRRGSLRSSLAPGGGEGPSVKEDEVLLQVKMAQVLRKMRTP
jgi:hypothetical protein